MLLTKSVKIRIAGPNRKYYRGLGYNVNTGDIIEVPIEDLPHACECMVEVVCEYCGKTFQKRYKDRNKQIKASERQEIPYKDCCADCNMDKMHEKCVLIYGVAYPMQSQELRQKIEATNVERRGVPNAAQSEEVRTKMRKTMMNKYGVEYATQLDWVKEKVRNTNIDRYGVPTKLILPEVQQKSQEGHARNGTAPSSEGQRYIAKLYNGVLNYPLCNRFIDIMLYDDALAVEYDGSGHNLRVLCGAVTQEQFDIDEKRREQTILNFGLRILRLSSKTDKLPTDLTLNEILSMSLYNMDRYGYKICRCNLDTFEYNFE